MIGSIFNFLFSPPSAEFLLKQPVLIEDFESMLIPQHADPVSTEQLFLVDSFLPSAGWVVCQGPRDAKKWRVSVVKGGYPEGKSKRCVKLEWNNKNGVWLNFGIWFSEPQRWPGAQQISFWVKTEKPAKFDVTVRVLAPNGKEVVFWKATPKIYQTGRWVRISLPLYRFTVPGWFKKEVGGKVALEKFPDNPVVRAVSISPVWHSEGTAFIDFIQYGLLEEAPKKLIPRKRLAWEKIRSFVCYYGGDAVEEIAGGERPFSLFICESSNYTKEEIEKIKKAGVWVVGYVTIGEDDELHRGDGKGPGGYASYYLDADGDNMPDMNPNWKSYYVNAGNPLWQEWIIKHKIPSVLEKGCDGIFMDTVDTVSLYPETLEGMVDLIKKIRQTYPEIKIVQNRGFAVLPRTAPYIDAVMFEDFSINYDWTRDVYSRMSDEELAYAAAEAINNLVKVQQREKRRGHIVHVVALDYAEPFQKKLIGFCYARAWAYGFIPYVSTILLDEVYPVPDYVVVEGDSLFIDFDKDGRPDLDIDGDSKPDVVKWGQWRDGSEPVFRKYMEMAQKGEISREKYKDMIVPVGDNLARIEKKTKVEVDSIYQGYGLKAKFNLIDGLRNNPGIFWKDAAWASAEIPSDHWIEIVFHQANPSNPVPKPVREVHVYWAWDNGRYWASSRYLIQVWDDTSKKWITVKEIKSKNSNRKVDKVKLDKKYMTTKLRIFQPKKCGPAERPYLMWVAEVEVYPEVVK